MSAARGRGMLGAVLPTREIGSDPAEIRIWADGVAALGYGHVAVADHVLGIASAAWKGRRVRHSPSGRTFSEQDDFHEPLVLLAFLAAIAPELGLLTSVLILPQRQATLVAKQAAELDALSGGRLRLGVGLGWNPLEYEALGADWSRRGAMLEEQIELMRRLWTEQTVSFEGRFHHLPPAGLRPKPAQRRLPIWIGGRSEAALRRVGRLGDGWILDSGTGVEAARAGRRTIEEAAEGAGRDPAAIGLEARVAAASAEVEPALRKWRAAAAARVAIDTQGGGLRGADDHLRLLETVAVRWDAVCAAI